MGDPRPRACPHISEPPHPIYEKASLQHFAKESFMICFWKIDQTLWNLWLFESQLANFGCSVPWGRKLWRVKFHEAWNLNPQKLFLNITKGENPKFLQVEIAKIYNIWQSFNGGVCARMFFWEWSGYFDVFLLQ